MKKILIYTTVIAFLTAGCEKETKVDIPPHQSKFVVQGILQENALFNIRVTKSLGILTPRNLSDPELPYQVPNAAVVVYENGVFLDTLRYDAVSKTYKTLTNKRVILGKSYQLGMVAPGIPVAQSTTMVPSKPVINSITRVRNARTNSSGEQLDDFTISFNDPAGESNFYAVRVRYSFGGAAAYGSVFCVYSNDIDIEKDNSNDPFSTENCLGGDQLLVRDVNFNGRTKQLKLSVQGSELPDFVDAGTGRRYRPIIELWRITEDHFKYLKTKAAAGNAQDNPFAEPANVYSNIQNGYGVFTTYTRAVDSIR
jgi:hypothetical protein